MFLLKSARHAAGAIDIPNLFSGCGSFGLGCGSLGVLFALTAFGHGVGHGGGDQTDGADRVVVAGDDIVDFVRIAVGVNDRDDG